MNWKKHLLTVDKNREGELKNSGELKKSVEPKPGTAPGERNNERPREFCGTSVPLGLNPDKIGGNPGVHRICPTDSVQSETNVTATTPTTPPREGVELF